MDRLGFVAALGLAIVGLAPAARADDKADRELQSRRFDQLRIGVNAVAFAGTSLVGVGSQGRHRGFGAALEVDIERFSRARVGFGGVLHVFPPTATDRDDSIPFVRGELFAAAALAAWEGSLPGSLVVGAGPGADWPRYWFSEDGRFYGLAFARVRLFTSRHTRVQLTYAAVPVAYTTAADSLHEHRFEVATRWKLLEFGGRVAYTFARGGLPARDFIQQELGAFVALSLY